MGQQSLPEKVDELTRKVAWLEKVLCSLEEALRTKRLIAQDETFMGPEDKL